MSFIHDAADFGDLVRVVAADRHLAPGLVEKDYWVTHALSALQAQGLETWFKGGTSLSKGFGLIERFSEDLDLKLEPGELAGLPGVTNWKSEGTRATQARIDYFEALERELAIPGAEVVLDRERADRSHRSATFQVRYPGRFLGDLGGILPPFVLLEVGSARVLPCVPRDLDSLVHEQLRRSGLAAEFTDNRALGVRCVHPLVTLLEKLDAISRRFPKVATAAATFVRHYEDAAHIIARLDELPHLPTSPRSLCKEMVDQKQLRRVPDAGDPAFSEPSAARWEPVHRAHADIHAMFWGERIGLDEACSRIRVWITEELAEEQ